MLALAKTGPEPGLKLIDRPVPVVKDPHDVLVEVGACGICGSDVDAYKSDPRNLHPLAKYGWPRVLGHEIAGTVREIGKAVIEFEPGDKVVCEVAPPCGHCYYCSRGLPNLCGNTAGKALSTSRDGGYAKYVLVDPHYLYRLPEKITMAEAAIIEPVGVAVRAVERSHVKPGDTVAIIGPGPIGLLGAMLLKSSGIGSLVVAGRETSRERLKVAAEIGATIVEIHGDNLRDMTREMTGGLGVDVVFDFGGGSEAAAQAVSIVRRGGEVVLVGAGDPRGFDQNKIMMKEIAVIGSIGRVDSTWHRAINLVANRAIDVSKVLTHTLPLAEYEKGFQLLIDRKALKVVLVP